MAQFTYNGDGQRVKSVVDGKTILFVGGYFELDVTTTPAKITKYYPGGAIRKYTIPQSMNVEYVLGDHLGSASVMTDSTGNKTSEMRYSPWGQVRYHWVDPALSTTPAYTLPKPTFTGQYSYMDDPSTQTVTEGFGLMFYQSRFYDPVIGRFAQADTVVPGGVQGLDRYAYVSNNPVKYVDPSGHLPTDGECGLHGEECDPWGSESVPPSPSSPTSFKPKVPTCASGDLNCLLNQWWKKNGTTVCNDIVQVAHVCDPDFWKQGGQFSLELLQYLPGPLKDAIVALLNSGAGVTQDLATLVDFVGVAIVFGLTLASCPMGCAEGTLAGLLIWATPIFNGTETGLSWASTLLTISADLMDDRKWGESSSTSVATSLAGTVAFDPFTDLIIDGYASGYNHGLFCGIYTLIECLEGQQ
jgi:RHS repeat-associated protein